MIVKIKLVTLNRIISIKYIHIQALLIYTKSIICKREKEIQYWKSNLYKVFQCLWIWVSVLKRSNPSSLFKKSRRKTSIKKITFINEPYKIMTINCKINSLLKITCVKWAIFSERVEFIDKNSQNRRKEDHFRLSF